MCAKILGFLGAGQTIADGTQQNSRAPLYLCFTSIGCQEPTYLLFLQSLKRSLCFAKVTKTGQCAGHDMVWLTNRFPMETFGDALDGLRCECGGLLALQYLEAIFLIFGIFSPYGDSLGVILQKLHTFVRRGHPLQGAKPFIQHGFDSGAQTITIRFSMVGLREHPFTTNTKFFFMVGKPHSIMVMVMMVEAFENSRRARSLR